MQRVTVELAEHPYDIWIGPGLIGRLDEFIAPLAPTSIHIVTNATVGALFGDSARITCKPVAATSCCTIADGEAVKDLHTVSQVIDAQRRLNARRPDGTRIKADPVGPSDPRHAYLTRSHD